MIRFVNEYESTKPKQHLIGMTGAPIKTPDMFASAADWISPVGKQYLDNPPVADGRKLVVVDTDHIAPWGGDPKWVWKNLCRGNHFIAMDSHMDFRAKSPARPVPDLDALRRAMGQAVDIAGRVDLVGMRPQGTLSSTGYCLANPGHEYVVYLPDGGKATVDLSGHTGEMSVEWFIPSTGQTLPAGTFPCGGQVGVSVPQAGDAVLLLRRFSSGVD